MNFGRGSGDADLGFHKRALGSKLPALMPQCNECPLNSMEHASTEHSVNSFIILAMLFTMTFLVLKGTSKSHNDLDMELEKPLFHFQFFILIGKILRGAEG